MKIKTKLSLLITIVIAAIVLSVGINMYSNNFVGVMVNEEKALIELRDLMLQQRIELNILVNNTMPTVMQYKVIKEKIDKINQSMKKVKELKILPTLTKKTTYAFKSIIKLEELLNASYSKLYKSTDEFLELFPKNDTTYSITNVDNYKNNPNYAKIKFRSYKVITDVHTVDIALEAAADVLSDQYKVITETVNYNKRLALIVSLIVVVFSILISSLITLLIAKTITKSINSLIDDVSIMVTGDFTQNITIKSKDELGTLGKDLILFQENLNQSLVKIKESSKANEDANIALIETSSDSSAVTTEISANIDSINSQMTQLDENIDMSNSEVQVVSSFTNELHDFTSEQMSMVEESTAAITEMIASITSISDLTKKNSDIMNVLEFTAKEGDNKLTETTDLIDEINSRITEINEMSEIIKTISEQTNLLAMNAAIEAAHAGDAGKGFAVVADEIRKLAEASALNSVDISNNLNDITTKFEQASLSGSSTREAFTNINDNIKNVSSALMVVSSSTSELDTGGSQILGAMENLKEISISVQDKAYEMKMKTENIEQLSSNVYDISQTVSGAISEANIGFVGVTDSMSSLKDVSDRVGAASKEINYEINKFKTT